MSYDFHVKNSTRLKPVSLEDAIYDQPDSNQYNTVMLIQYAEYSWSILDHISYIGYKLSGIALQK